MERGQRKKLATLVGCNYAGTPNELQGCINDVIAMRETLIARFGFSPADITVLTDDHGSSPALPTGANIKRALSDMVARAAPGDVLFFHYSGHGTLVPPRHHHGGHGERDEEAIVPCDFNLITDVDFRRLVDTLPRGASFTMVSDSCHSGGLIDLEKEQIGPSSVLAAGASAPAATPRRVAARFLPYAAVIEHLAGVSGVDAAHHVAEHLLALFGTDASAKFHHHHGEHEQPAPARADDGILLSGCQADETSADVAVDDDAVAAGGKACGAFSNALQTVLASRPAPAPVSNRELVSMARKVLSEQEFEQHPCLYCSDANADAPFLGQQEEETVTVAAAAVEETAMSAL